MATTCYKSSENSTVKSTVSVASLFLLHRPQLLTTDPQGVIKRIKLKYWQVNDLPIGQRVIVHFDEQAAAYGEAQGLLAGYIGTLAILSNLFPINFERWSGKYKGMPCSYFDNCFERLLKPRFKFMTTEAPQNMFVCNRFQFR
ncbi:hypothetical protein P8452_11152 [Trifolium repens]|nr:hypothetical protein P8452_11152 [Trifolium repens]